MVHVPDVTQIVVVVPVKIPIVKYRTMMELAAQERANPADARIAPAIVTARQP